MMNKTILMLSVSCMSFIAGADLCYAGFNPDDTPPVLNAAMLKSHVSTHTSHLTAAHLSSLEDIAELTLPENSGRDREGFKPSLALPNSLGREEKTKQSSSDLIRGSRWKKSAALSDLDTPVKPEYDGLTKGDNKLTQLAAACFVTDTRDCTGNEFANGDNEDDNGGVPPGGGDDYDLDNDKRCIEEGYTQTSCSEGYEPYNYCPYDNTYFERCRKLCPSNYVECEKPYYGVGEACEGKYASCRKDTGKACLEENPEYTNRCGWGQTLGDDRCSYDSSYGICCNTCAGYPYTKDNIPNGYVQDGEPCVDCDGNEKVKIKPNPCDGYMDCGSVGGEWGAKTCLSGTTTMYDNCKPCPNRGTLNRCPEHYICTYEECSNKYYPTGCESGYEWNSKTQTCTEECDSSYKYACDGSAETGYGEACNGLYKSCSCTENCYTWSSSSGCYNSYQYTCSGPGAMPGSDSCNGLYSYCSCEDKTEGIGFYNDSTGCACIENNCYNHKYTCDKEHELPDEEHKCCNGMYSQCKCEEPYEWKNGACVCPDSFQYTCVDDDGCMSGVAPSCGGKYQSCSCSCGWNTVILCMGDKQGIFDAGPADDYDFIWQAKWEKEPNGICMSGKPGFWPEQPCW